MKTMHSFKSTSFILIKIYFKHKHTLHCFILPCTVLLESIGHSGTSYHILISNCDNLLRCLSNWDLNERLMSRFLIMYGIRIAKQMRQTPIRLITIPGSASS